MPAGFRQAVGSGLLLPEDISRERQVWTKDEWKLLNRASRLFGAKGMHLLLKCINPACKDAPIERVPDGTGFILRCAHLDRVFQRTF